jgi:multimeric flavodoxin WrbA
MDAPIYVRKGKVAPFLTHEEFRKRFHQRFYDPAFQVEAAAIERLEAIAWDAYVNGRKSPITEKAGLGYADPDYDLSVQWKENKTRLDAAQQRQSDPNTPSRVLVIAGSSRNDGTCPGEISKTWRLSRIACDAIRAHGVEADLLDLSVLTSEYEHKILPCKGCVSTAMPLCHWPCSCYPNHALGQANYAMAEIYEKWVQAHGVMIVTPTYWYQSPSPLKLMIDRLVCADGGNPDPSSTEGKDAKKAKELELAGWSYPKHLAGRAYGVVTHGDVAGIEETRRALTDWLEWMGLVPSGQSSRLDRYIGYYEPYATSHDALDRDTAVQQEVRNAAHAVCNAVKELRSGRLPVPDKDIDRPRPK